MGRAYRIPQHSVERWIDRVNHEASPEQAAAEMLEFLETAREAYAFGNYTHYANDRWPGTVIIVKVNKVPPVVMTIQRSSYELSDDSQPPTAPWQKKLKNLAIREGWLE